MSRASEACSWLLCTKSVISCCMPPPYPDRMHYRVGLGARTRGVNAGSRSYTRGSGNGKVALPSGSAAPGGLPCPVPSPGFQGCTRSAARWPTPFAPTTAGGSWRRSSNSSPVLPNNYWLCCLRSPLAPAAWSRPKICAASSPIEAIMKRRDRAILPCLPSTLPLSTCATSRTKTTLLPGPETVVTLTAPVVDIALTSSVRRAAGLRNSVH